MDDTSYLEPDFDPSTLRVADLRKILLFHNVPFPSVSKKQDLINLFNNNVVANAASIIAAQKKIKPSGRGILMVGDKKTSELYYDSNEEQEESPVEAKKERRGRKPAKREASSALGEEIFVVPASKPRGRKKETTAPAEPVPTFESETPAATSSRLPARRGRKKKAETSMLTDTDDNTKPSRDKSPFSDHNPFQSSGESPQKSSRRKSGGLHRCRSTSRPRRVDYSSDLGTPLAKSGYFSPGQPTPPSNVGDASERTPAFPVNSPAALTTPTSAGPQKFMSPPLVSSIPGTEYLPEKKRSFSPFASTPAVAGTSMASAATPGVRSPKKKAKKKDQGEMIVEEEVYSWSSIWVVMFLAFVAYGVWWRNEKIKIGYCGQAEMMSRGSNNEAPHPLAFLFPTCIPCPAHAQCSNGQIECDPDFLRILNRFSLGGLIPLPDKCVPDSEKQERAVELAGELLHRLSIRAGDVECDLIKTDKSLPKDEVAGIKIEDAFGLLIDLKNPSITDKQFQEYWRLALSDLKNHPDQVEFFNSTRGEGEYLVSRKPRLYLACRLRKNFVAILWKHKNVLAGIIFFLCLTYFLRLKWIARKQDAKVIGTLVQAALNKLMDQEHFHYVDPVQFPYPCVPVAHLRDLLLAEEHSAKRRQYLWEGVRNVVEANSNVRARMMEVKGEPHRGWEWVGGISVKKEEAIYPVLYPAALPTAPL